jgi:hypothetical protein
MPPPFYDPFSPPVFPAARPQAINPLMAGRQPGASYNTPLSPLDEFAYRQWVQQNNVPTNPLSTAPQDYDMRGFYQGLQQGNPRAQSAIDPNDGRMHFNDFWKTPSHPKFSNESQWAEPSAPQWADNPFNQLITQGGRVLADDRAQNTGGLLAGLLGLK